MAAAGLLAMLDPAQAPAVVGAIIFAAAAYFLKDTLGTLKGMHATMNNMVSEVRELREDHRETRAKAERLEAWRIEKERHDAVRQAQDAAREEALRTQVTRAIVDTRVVRLNLHDLRNKLSVPAFNELSAQARAESEETGT